VRLFLAGRFRDRAELRRYANQLELLDHIVLSSWLLEPDEDGRVDIRRDLQKASRDLGEVLLADALILDSREPTRRGGRCVEAGAAWAMHTPVYVVGTPRNLYESSLARRTFTDWETLIRTFSADTWGPSREWRTESVS
jgi:hypothetical protein